MDFTAIFTAYYRQFRGEATVPGSTDEEYTLGLSLANAALNRWANYDGTYWKELYTTAQTTSTGGVVTITAGTSSYAAPTAMREAGGNIQITETDGTLITEIPIVQPEQVQFLDKNSSFAYFTGNPSSGFTLKLNPTPDSTIDGKKIDYTYYRKPTEYSTGTDKSEIANPYFVVNYMLAQRFQIERNYGGYQIAKRDSEELLKNMQHDNNSGTWADSWSMPDNSGSSWGV